MIQSQAFVVGWIQVMLAASLMLGLTRLFLLRLPQPADRINVILCSLVAVIGLPLLMLFAGLPQWRLGLVTAIDEPRSVRSVQSIAEVAAPKEPLSVEQTYPFDKRPDSKIDDVEKPSTQLITNIEATPPVPSQRQFRRDAWFVVALVIVSLHGLAITFSVLEWVIGFVQLRRIVRGSTLSSTMVLQAWNDVTSGRGSRVRLLVSPSIDAPLMYGFWQTVVLIPKSMSTSLTDCIGSPLRLCLAHEWSHIERSDLLAWRFVWACQSFLFPVASYWRLRKELRLCQDLIADNRAAEADKHAIEYSELLVGLAKQRMSSPAAGALMFFDRSSPLKRRIQSLLQRTISIRSYSPWKVSISAMAAAVVFAFVVSSVRLDGTRAAEQTAVPDSRPSDKQIDSKSPQGGQTEALVYDCVVVDKETGSGVSGARVVVWRFSESLSKAGRTEETRHITDANGKYQVVFPPEQVADESLFVEVGIEHDSYAPFNRAVRYPLSLIREETRKGERPFFVRTEMYPGEAVTGTAVSELGTPLSGVKVKGYSIVHPNDHDTSSFTETQTDTNGRFRLNLHRGVEGAIWIIPKDRSIVEKFLERQRGELGEVVVPPGIRLQGRVLTADGRPAAGVALGVSFAGKKGIGKLPISGVVHRGTISDPDGSFSFAPLPPGEYEVCPRDYLSDPLIQSLQPPLRYEVPGAFFPHKLTLNNNDERVTVDVQAVPHAVITLRVVDSSGKPAPAPYFHLFGYLNDIRWSEAVHHDGDGITSLMVPLGLQRARAQLVTHYHEELRYRRGNSKRLLPLDGHYLTLGTITGDINDIELVRYKSPIVTIAAVDETGAAIQPFYVSGTYRHGRQTASVDGDLESDLSFHRLPDGRYRTDAMLPDEQVTFTAVAEGFRSSRNKTTLAEGKKKEITFTLKKGEDEDEDEETPTDKKADSTAESGQKADDQTASRTPGTNGVPKPPQQVVGVVHGRVVDSDSHLPMANVEVRLVVKPNGTWTFPLVPTRVLSKLNGEYRFENLPPGEYRVYAFHESRASRTVLREFDKATIDSEGRSSAVDLQMREGLTLKVRVVAEETGLPISKAKIRLIWTDLDDNAETDDAGEVVIRCLTAGVQHVEAKAVGYCHVARRQELKSPMTEIEFRLPKGGTVEGTVTDEKGQPLEGVVIGAAHASSYLGIDRAESDALGRFKLQYLPISEKINVSAKKKRFQLSENPISLNGMPSQDLAIRLLSRLSGGDVIATIVDAEGQPISGAVVRNFGNSTDDTIEAKSDANGKVAIRDLNLVRAKSTLFVQAEGFAPREIAVPAEAALTPIEMTIKLDPGHSIKGKVTNERGEPIPGAWVFFAGGGHGYSGLGGKLITDEQGRFESNSLPRNCPFDIFAQGFSRKEGIIVPLDQNQETLFVLEPSARFRGRVLDAKTSQPIKNFNIKLDWPSRIPSGATKPTNLLTYWMQTGIDGQDEKGEFVWPDMQTKTAYDLIFSADGYQPKTLAGQVALPDADELRVFLRPKNDR